VNLSESEKRTISFDTAELIQMSGERAKIFRPQLTGVGSFAGPHAESETLIAEVPIEFRQLSPQERKQIGADGECSMLPEADIREGDLVVIGEIRFVATDVRVENCFGAVTHKTVRLEREYQADP
jgi:sorbitol-specific phosphotransferase system component IIA